MKKQISPRLISIIFSILVICFALGFYIFAWTEPLGDPPTDNVSVPLNVSNLDQTKTGALGFSEFRDVNDDTYYINPSGAVSAILSGNVGIGTTGPGAKLDVQGQVYINNTVVATPKNVLTLNAYSNNYAHFYDPALGPTNGGIAIGGSATMTGVPSTPVMFWNVNNGNVGIGTTSPNAKLQVAGGDVYASTAGNGLILKSPDGLTCKRVSIDNAGNLITTAVTCP